VGGQKEERIMKRAERFIEVVLGTVVVMAGVVCPRAICAADATVGMDFVSAYVFRGNTFNDGAVLQPGLSVSNFKVSETTTLPLTLGVWANMDIGDYDDTLDEGEFSEVDFTASYALPTLVDKLGWSVGYCEYMYPGGADTDREVNLGFTYDTFLSPSLTFNYGLDGALQDNWYIEGGLKHAFDLDPVTLTLSGTLGYQILSGVDTPQFTVTPGATLPTAVSELVPQYVAWAQTPRGGAEGFGPLVLTASASYKILTASVSYVAEIDDDVLANYDVEIVGKLGVAYTF
jgi:uncharacterized protein (TIGR02001 family)